MDFKTGLDLVNYLKQYFPIFILVNSAVQFG